MMMNSKKKILILVNFNIFFRKSIKLYLLKIKEILPSDLNQIVAFKKPKSSTIVRKTINGFAYVGFNPKELTELAGFQETPLLLNNLTAKMGFKSSFLRYWSPIIRSEASCAILQDSFWWFFLKYFKVNFNCKSNFSK
jgi:hypothetical protein